MQGLTALLLKKGFLMSSLNLHWRSLEPFPRVPSLDPREKSLAPPAPLPCLGKRRRAMRSPLGFLYSQLHQPKGLSRSSREVPSGPVTLLLTHSSTCTSFLNGGAQNRTWRSRRGRTNAEYGWTMASLHWPAMPGSMRPGTQSALSAAGARRQLPSSLLPTGAPGSLSARPLASCSSPGLDLCPTLFPPRCGIQHLDLFSCIP